ncbi:hypothetical protein [Wolbachia endosymbiont of Folsomia candida]|uniref:hypothetical protein n=1 Tax=Wolbachia endosymbiont of Folsomia candida TaxID=169402 RepID=UPI000A8DCE64|nr:hypothetical protein [Wolbachia endosymbiont of Folsomia candida]APR97755.1 hypothetical protein ASM33_00130 [Wolbachia endosymbiont of Folsomia candida]
MKNLSSNQATKSYKLHTPNYLLDKEAEASSDMERYGIMSDSIKFPWDDEYDPYIYNTYNTINTPNYWSDNEAEAYSDMERYGIVSGSFGLAKEIAQRIALPIGDHVAKKIIVPIGDHVVREIMVPVGKHFTKDIALPVAKYIAKDIVLPIAKEVSAEIKDLTIKLTKGLTEHIKEIIRQEIDVMQNKIKALPSEIIEGVKNSLNIKLPWKAPTMETADEDHESYTYNTYSGLEI